MAYNVTLSIGANTAPLTAALNNAFNRQWNIGRINTSGIARPLGAITGKASEFSKSMDAANARVLAFGSSAGAIAVLKIGFDSLARSTIEVEKRLGEINLQLNLSAAGLSKFRNELFKVAVDTSSSFGEAAQAATEFSRQGLGLQETLDRTKASLMLVKLAGMDVANSINSITATINSFKSETLSAVDIVNRFAAVDARFAVSSNDLAEAVKRVGSSAEDAGVSLNQTIAIVTAAQQTTARGGAVIGNAFKSIFTRLQRPKVLDTLDELGIKTKNAYGETLPLMEVLQGLASRYDSLTSAQRSSIAELVGGVYQVNILKASLSDLNSQYGSFKEAVEVANNSMGAADNKINKLNELISSKLNRTLTQYVELGSKVGNLTLAPTIKGGLDFGGDIATTLSKALDSKSLGGNLVRGVLGGIGDAIKGPGVQLLTFGLLKLIGRFVVFAKSSALEFAGIVNSGQNLANLTQATNQYLAQNPAILKQVHQGALSVSQVQQMVTASIKQQNALLAYQAGLAGKVAAGLQASGATTNYSGSRIRIARGFIPNFNSEEEEARKHGYTAGRVYQRKIYPGDGMGGKGKPFIATVNSRETIKDTPVGTFVVPPNGFARGFTPNGHIPNFESSFLLKNLKQKMDLGIASAEDIKLYQEMTSSPDSSKIAFSGEKKFSNEFGEAVLATTGAGGYDISSVNIPAKMRGKGGSLGLYDQMFGFLREKGIEKVGGVLLGQGKGKSEFPFATLKRRLQFGKETSVELLNGQTVVLKTMEDLQKFSKEISKKDIRAGLDVSTMLAGGFFPNFADPGFNLIKTISTDSIVWGNNQKGNFPGFDALSLVDVNGKKVLFPFSMKTGKDATTPSRYNAQIPGGLERMKDSKVMEQINALFGMDVSGVPMGSTGLISNEGGSSARSLSKLKAVAAGIGQTSEIGFARQMQLFAKKGNRTVPLREKDYELAAVEKMQDPEIFSDLIASTQRSTQSMNFGFARGFVPNFLQKKYKKYKGGKITGKQSSRVADKGLDTYTKFSLELIKAGSKKEMEKEYEEKLESLMKGEEKGKQYFMEYGNLSEESVDLFIKNLQENLKSGETKFKSLVTSETVDLENQKKGLKRAILGKVFEKGKGLDAIRNRVNKDVQLSESSTARMDYVTKSGGEETAVGEAKYGDTRKDNIVSKIIESKHGKKFLDNGPKADNIQMPNNYFLVVPGAASGFIPNFNDSAILDAVAREKAAGYSSSQVKISKDQRLISSQNPMGFGVFNSTEGSLSNGIGLALKAGINPKTKGAARGHVPNFADFGFSATMGAAQALTMLPKIQSMLDPFARRIQAAEEALKPFTDAVGAARQSAETFASARERQGEQAVGRFQIGNAPARDISYNQAGVELSEARQRRRGYEAQRSKTTDPQQVARLNRLIQDELNNISAMNAVRRNLIATFPNLRTAVEGEIQAARALATAERQQAQQASSAENLKKDQQAYQNIQSKIQTAGYIASAGAPMIGQMIAANMPEGSESGRAVTDLTSGIGKAAQALSALPPQIGAPVAAMMLTASAYKMINKDLYYFDDSLILSTKRTTESAEKTANSLSSLSTASENYQNVLNSTSSSAQQLLNAQEDLDRAISDLSTTAPELVSKFKGAGSPEERNQILREAQYKTQRTKAGAEMASGIQKGFADTADFGAAKSFFFGFGGNTKAKAEEQVRSSSRDIMNLLTPESKDIVAKSGGDTKVLIEELRKISPDMADTFEQMNEKQQKADPGKTTGVDNIAKEVSAQAALNKAKAEATAELEKQHAAEINGRKIQEKIIDTLKNQSSQLERFKKSLMEVSVGIGGTSRLKNQNKLMDVFGTVNDQFNANLQNDAKSKALQNIETKSAGLGIGGNDKSLSAIQDFIVGLDMTDFKKSNTEIASKIEDLKTEQISLQGKQDEGSRKQADLLSEQITQLGNLKNDTAKMAVEAKNQTQMQKIMANINSSFGVKGIEDRAGARRVQTDFRQGGRMARSANGEVAARGQMKTLDALTAGLGGIEQIPQKMREEMAKASLSGIEANLNRTVVPMMKQMGISVDAKEIKKMAADQAAARFKTPEYAKQEAGRIGKENVDKFAPAFEKGLLKTNEEIKAVAMAITKQDEILANLPNDFATALATKMEQIENKKKENAEIKDTGPSMATMQKGLFATSAGALVSAGLIKGIQIFKGRGAAAAPGAAATGAAATGAAATGSAAKGAAAAKAPSSLKFAETALEENATKIQSEMNLLDQQTPRTREYRNTKARLKTALDKTGKLMYDADAAAFIENNSGTAAKGAKVVEKQAIQASEKQAIQKAGSQGLQSLEKEGSKMAQSLSKVNSKITPAFGKIAGGAVAAGFAIFDFADRIEQGQSTSEAATGAGLTAVGGIAGAAFGSVLGPIGTIVGGAIGSIVAEKVGGAVESGATTLGTWWATEGGLEQAKKNEQEVQQASQQKADAQNRRLLIGRTQLEGEDKKAANEADAKIAQLEKLLGNNNLSAEKRGEYQAQLLNATNELNKILNKPAEEKAKKEEEDAYKKQQEAQEKQFERQTQESVKQASQQAALQKAVLVEQAKAKYGASDKDAEKYANREMGVGQARNRMQLAGQEEMARRQELAQSKAIQQQKLSEEKKKALSGKEYGSEEYKSIEKSYSDRAREIRVATTTQEVTAASAGAGGREKALTLAEEIVGGIAGGKTLSDLYGLIEGRIPASGGEAPAAAGGSNQITVPINLVSSMTADEVKNLISAALSEAGLIDSLPTELAK